jgi:hypothetical protein
VGFHKQLDGDAGLLDRASQRADCEFPVHRDDTAFVSAAEDNMTAFLAHHGETQSFEVLNGILA